MSDTEIVRITEYDEDADLNVEYDDEDGAVVTNHDEVEKYDVARCIAAETAEEYNMDVIEPDSSRWRDEFDDFTVGDTIRI